MRREAITAAALTLSAGLLFIGACSSPPAAAGPEEGTQPKGPARLAALTEMARTRPAGPFDAQILEVAGNYREKFVRVSDRTRWGSPLCVGRLWVDPLESASKDIGTHGRKLYYLFARDGEDYLQRATRYDGSPIGREKPYQAPVGQALVKQSFFATPVAPSQPPSNEEPSLVLVEPAVKRSPTGTATEYQPEYAKDAFGVFHRTGSPSELFIMLKMDPATPGTDQGWVYATTTSDGKTIMDAGRISSCMGCHRENTQNRLFGLRREQPEKPGSPKP